MRPLRGDPNRPARCMQAARRIQSYLDGELDDLSARRIAAHLRTCRRCGLNAATYTRIKHALARSGTRPPPDAVDRLRAFTHHLLSQSPDAANHHDAG